MQDTFDWLYQRSKANSTKGIDLYNIIISENNILLAYRMIKSNTGSKTAGVDKQTISDFKIKNKEDFIQEVRGKLENFTAQAVRRVEIPKPNGTYRPLGIPTVSDRLIQQMILQVLNPICEAKFFQHSYGFRANRSTHDAITRCNHLVNRGHCHYVVDVDIKGFFDNVNHRRLLSQLYTIGVKDKRVLMIIKKMLKAPISHQGIPQKGTPQGAILSPLLSNVVLNDLDQWIASQWEYFPSQYSYSRKDIRLSALRKSSQLKEMYIVRYADDFKIFTKKYSQAKKIFYAVKGYLKERLKLEISEEKSRITNLRKRSSEFLGFEIKAVPKRKGHVAHTHVSKKGKTRIKNQTRQLLKNFKKNRSKASAARYNSYVLGIHNYYSIATHVNIDFSEIAYSLLYTQYNRLRNFGKYEVPRSPPVSYRKFYKGNYKTFKIHDTYLYPLADIRWKFYGSLSPIINDYTVEGRKKIYDKLSQHVGVEIRKMLLKKSTYGNIEYLDNQLSKYSMQNGKCAVTGLFLEAEFVHCHHTLPRHLGGTDDFSNLIIIHKYIHRLIHATEPQTIQKYIAILQLNSKQVEKVNKYREKCTLAKIY